jgi:isopentenyl-diphosphate delta-isomerase
MTGEREPEELVVLLDEAGRAVGTHPKATVHHADTPLHLAFSCYLLDGDGRLLLTRRAATKATWPDTWTNSCCGHPAPGESLRAAVARRLDDELGLAVVDLVLVLPAFRYRAVMPDGTVENEMCPVFVGRCPDPDALHPDPAEVGAAEWVPFADVRREVLSGRRAVSPWCREQLEELPEDPTTTTAPTTGNLPPAALL